jgi:hypothetical protein
VLILAALIALAARVDAAGEDARQLAIRYADALCGGVSDASRAPTLDGLYAEIDDDDDAEPVDEDAGTAPRAGQVEDGNDGDGDGDRDSDGDGDGDAALAEPGTEPPAAALAMLDAEMDPTDAIAAGDAMFAAAPAGAAEQYEQALRHQRPSRWGRLDVGVSLRRRWSEPRYAPASRRDELWLVATWRR